MAEFFVGKDWQTFMQILPTIPFETWETIWSTVVATLLALVIGLPLGVCLVTGEQGGVRPLPRWLMALLNGLVNLLRSVPFLILMIIVIPLSRAIVGTSIGTVASIVPLVIASFPFVSRLVETSMREVDGGVIEAAQSMGATPLQIITKVMVPRACRPCGECDDRGDHHHGLRRYGRHHRRRRSGQDRHQLRLLPL